MQRMQVVALVAVMSLSAVPVARAGCCDDFWSCLAAAATGGLSCAVQGAIDELDAVKKRAEDARAAAVAERQRMLGLMQAETQRRASEAEAESQARIVDVGSQLARVAELKAAREKPAGMLSLKPPAPRALTQAQAPAANATLSSKAVTLAPGKADVAVTPPPSQPASDADIKAEIERALAKLRALKGEVAAHHQKLRAEELAAYRRTSRSVFTGMRDAFEASLIAPLVGLLASLPPPDPLLTAAMVAGVVSNLERIEREGNAALAAKSAEADAALKAENDKIALKLADQSRREEQARTLADQVEKVVEARQQQDLNVLREILGSAPAKPAHAPLTEAPFIAANLKLSTSSARPLSAQPGPPAPAALQQYDSKARAELGAKLAARDSAEQEKKKSALVAEARRRFAKDPATRDKVVAYIESQPAPAP